MTNVMYGVLRYMDGSRLHVREIQLPAWAVFKVQYEVALKPAGFRSPLCEDNYDRRMGKMYSNLQYEVTCRQPQEKHGALHTRLLPAPMTAVVSGNRGEASGIYHSARPPPHANVGLFSTPLETTQLRHT
ncbi:hypothetical protein PspLS_04696 [Pyricularia sp. CBS 133598]|nr:hypothetical protein PspLS_04696 [Pyricularia sp. CBS 133598]